MRRRNYWDYPGPGDMPHPQDDDLESWRPPDDMEIDLRDRLASKEDDEDGNTETTTNA